MLEVGLADDPRLAVRAAAVMSNRKLFDPERREAADCRTIEGRAPEAAEAQHDAVVAGVHGTFETDVALGAARRFCACGVFASAASDTRTISLSLRAKTLFIAKAGCDQIVMRRMT